ncbi:hypothetical protein QFC21_002838 [Naganishia friedmannii]|uniref:Uncharacterized protein n=1 Tax=Naganishia friedmannii TaxID=89922 RepID=A0ACC2VTJ5_9TREE|nr:hypothetical protein QFC21_002838 [Naganishia friedmannii]
MDQPEDVVQAGSLCLLLESMPKLDCPSDWSDIGSYIGQKTDRRAILRATIRLSGDALVVRVYLLPWIGPTVQLKKATKEQLHRIMKSIQRRWSCEDMTVGQDEGNLVFSNTDTRTITSLYQSIPSPSPSIDDISRVTDHSCQKAARRVLTNAGGSDHGAENAHVDVDWRRLRDGNLAAMGLNTRLYTYQRKSVAQMCIQEAAPARIEDIKFVKMKEVGKDGFYYIDLSSGEVRRKCDVGLYDLPRGGILCEEMGTGKTLIALSLILATRRQRTTPDETTSHSSVVTDVGRAISSTLKQETRLTREASAVGMGAKGTLAEIALHRLLCCRSTNFAEDEEDEKDVKDVKGQKDQKDQKTIPLLPEWAHNALSSDPPFYYQHPKRDESCRRSVTRPIIDHRSSLSKKIYLSCATLVIVPRLLVKQWEGEIVKHFTKGSLKCFSVHQELPSRDEVLASDIVLISDANEGHVASTGSGGLMELARKTCSEAFWAISGTPTKHALSSTIARDTAVSGKWSDEAIKDIGRLLGIVTNLLQMKPFDITGKSIANSPTTLVINPLRGTDGPVCGAVERLAQLVNSIMVRNREEDIAAEIKLDPLEERRHGLCLDHLGRLTYNVLQAVYAVNVVTSRRVGPDYLLSPENRSDLMLAFQNLQTACCWNPTGNSKDFDPKFTLSVLAEYLEPEKLGSFSEQDQQMMKEAERWLSAAVQDEIWQSLMLKISVPLYASRLPTEALHASSHFPLADDGTALTTAEVLLALRDAAAKITDEDQVSGKLVGAAISARKRETLIVAEGRLTKGARINGKKTPEKNCSQQTKSRAAARSLQRSGRVATIDLREMQNVNNEESTRPISTAVRKRKRSQPPQNCDTTSIATKAPPLPREVQELHVAFKTLSSKLNWIVAEILGNENDTFIVFGRDAVVLGQLTEVPSGFGWSVKVTLLISPVSLHVDAVLFPASCYVGIGLSDIRAREAAVDIFQQKMRRVCLIEITMAGRGLYVRRLIIMSFAFEADQHTISDRNLVVANRVIFAEPVWKEDVEQQAIARARRIGQQRPVICDTLFIKGSPEQDVLEQRHGSTLRDAADNHVIQNFIANPKFIEETAPPRSPFVVPLVKQSPPENEVLMAPPATPPQEYRNQCAYERPTKRARTRTPSPCFGNDVSASQYSVTAIQQSSGLDTLLGSDSPEPMISSFGNKVRRRVAFQNE